MTKFNLADRVHIDNCTSITATITRISIWGDPANPQTQYHVEYFHEGYLREYWFDEWRLTRATAPLGATVFGEPLDLSNPEHRAALGPVPEYVVRVGEANGMNTTSVSECDKCGALSPSAPPGYIHKCGECSGGICHPVKKE